LRESAFEVAIASKADVTFWGACVRQWPKADIDALLVGTDPFFSVGGSNLPRWQRAMRSPRHTPYASIRKLVV